MNQTTDMNKKGAIFSTLLIIGGLIYAVWGWSYAANGHQSASWPTTNGQVTSAEVSAHAGSGSSDGSYSVSVAYTYQVDGQSYQSDRIAFNGARQYSDRADAQVVADRYPTGSAPAVYYNPDDPAVSVLKPGFSWQAYRPFGLAVLIIIFGLYALRDQLRSQPAATAAPNQTVQA